MSHTPCPEREAQLEASLFRELDESGEGELEAHVRNCAGCREALEDARDALNALSHVSDPPPPYAAVIEDDRARDDSAWQAFRKKMQPEAPPSRRAYRLAAMAACIVLGIGLGRMATTVPGPDSLREAGMDGLDIPPEAIAALERAELLSDVGVRYVEGLQSLLVDVMDLSVETVSLGDVVSTRERARELLEDGRLLERALDPDGDRALIRAVRRAELFLEELAAVEDSGSGTGVRVFQASLRASRLPDELAALDLEGEVSLAIEASGWLGRDDAARKEF